MNNLKTVAVAIALGLSSHGVYAEDVMDSPELMKPWDAQARIATLLERYDTNKDQVISLAEARGVKRADFNAADVNQDAVLTVQEWQAAREKRRAEAMQRRFDGLDMNKDGVLTLQEWQAKPSRNPQRQAMRFAHIDLNRDNHVTQQEWLAHQANRAHGTRRGMAANGQPPLSADMRRGRGAGGFARLDLNHDGVLRVEEFIVHVPLFKRFDRNHDQMLTLDELGQFAGHGMKRGMGYGYR